MSRPDDNPPEGMAHLTELDALPDGVMRTVAQRLQTLSDPTYSTDRPDGGSPTVATRALLELYRIAQEDKA